MAIKSDRRVLDTDITFFSNAVQEAGGAMSHVGAGASGVAVDSSVKLADYVANPSGVRPIGILLNDVVNKDLTRQHINWHKDEVQLGGKVTIMTHGNVTTDRVYTGHTPSPGTFVWVGHSGLLAESDVASDAVAANADYRKIGRFVTDVDEDGYAEVHVNV